MNRIFISIPLFFNSLIFPGFLVAQQSKPLLERKFRQGEIFRYRLTMDELHNGQWTSTLVSVCELKTVIDSNGVPNDEVRWISKKKITPKDTVDETNEALSVKPFNISVDIRGSLKIPKIEQPGMTEPIQDFITFFVAVSPQLGTTELNQKGDSIVNTKTIQADFSNGHPIIKGDDCFRVTKQLIDVTKKELLFKISFLPPDQSCFNYILDEMKEPVMKDAPNNFQMLQETGNDRLNVQYGREKFIINSTNRRSDGKIISATMSNTLNLKLKLNCNKEYKDCQGEFQFVMQRNLRLELL